MVCHSLLQWTTFCQTSPPWPIRLGWPHMAWLSFIELDKAVVHVIRFTSFLWLWFVCLPSDASRNTYHLTWVSLTLDVRYLFSMLQQSSATAPYLGWAVSPHSCPSWPWTWSSSSLPSCGVPYYLTPESQFCRGTLYLDNDLNKYILAFTFSSSVRQANEKGLEFEKWQCLRLDKVLVGQFHLECWFLLWRMLKKY